MQPIPIRAFECCVSFKTCDVLDAWRAQQRTPESIAREMAMVRRVRAGLSRPDRLVGVTEFPLSRLPLAHPNVQACLEHIGRG